MEMHHHLDLHHKPKRRKEYFLEFLMIFLAVTLDFFAENIREHFADKEKAKQSIATIVTAIESDSSQLKDIIASNKLSRSYLVRSFMLILLMALTTMLTSEAMMSHFSNCNHRAHYA